MPCEINTRSPASAGRIFPKNPDERCAVWRPKPVSRRSDDSGLKVADVDGFVSFNFNDSVPAISVATEIGVPAARYANDFLSGGNAANMIVLTAAAVIEAGLAETVISLSRA